MKEQVSVNDKLCCLCNDILDATESKYCEICIATNREQVRVDDKFVDDVETELACGHVAWDTIPATYICEAVIEVYKASPEYQHLKRLDENVKRRIAMHENQLPSGAACSNTELNILARIEFLKSLYNESTQKS